MILFSQSVNKYTEKKIFERFIVYYERTFMGDAISSVHLFEHIRWCIFERIQRGFPSTTNSLEGLHRGFNNLVNTRNLNLEVFIDALRLKTEKTRNTVSRYVTEQLRLEIQCLLEKRN
ncbi:hypothetical protein NGRA_2378 [Nosema granulosis]|uniref:Uncharacterized protein n=1 Tax=Nosema granulosis TaxID=83296 RepID=A0A9P6KYP7_9MICR|nr:hypothetical protein NGRA_2378 [Nosema granulosis]